MNLLKRKNLKSVYLRGGYTKGYKIKKSPYKPSLPNWCDSRVESQAYSCGEVGLKKFLSVFCNSLLILILFFSIKSYSQIVPFYPVEVFICPVGYTNNIPGSSPNLYTTFSSLKVVLNKDLPTLNKFTNTVSVITNLIKYHSITKSRDYFPFSFNPVLTTHFFATDILTIGIDLVNNIEFLPGINLDGKTSRYYNYRFRIRPFNYLILTPNIIMQQLFTYGRSFNSDKTARLNRMDKWEMVSNDYSILKYELKFIYLTKFHTRIFAIPYYFNTKYYDVAINKQKKIDKNLSKLLEEGFGCTFGLRYMTFTWGYAEGSFEFEKNFDKTYGGNSYTKLKFNAKWENQYFTERFGYLLMFDFIRHVSDGELKDFKSSSDTNQEIGQVELRGDIMPIFNLNRNVSIRPEFDIVYRYYTDKPNSIKYRYWLHLHVLL